jgi:hypothetical protein
MVEAPGRETMYFSTRAAIVPSPSSGISVTFWSYVPSRAWNSSGACAIMFTSFLLVPAGSPRMLCSIVPDEPHQQPSNVE